MANQNINQTKFQLQHGNHANTEIAAQIGLKMPDLNAIVHSCDEMLKIAANTRDHAKLLQKQIGELVRSGQNRPAMMRRQQVDSKVHDEIRVAVAPKQMINSRTSSATSFSSCEESQPRPHSVNAASQQKQQPKLKSISTMAAPRTARPTLTTMLSKSAQQKQLMANRKANNGPLRRQPQPPPAKMATVAAAGPKGDATKYVCANAVVLSHGSQQRVTSARLAKPSPSDAMFQKSVRTAR